MASNGKIDAVHELMVSGGFSIVPSALRPLQEGIARIEKAKETVAGYDHSTLELVSGVKPEEFSDRFYRGKPPLKQKQEKLKDDTLELPVSYLETFGFKAPRITLPSPLTRSDVQKYLKEWKTLQEK